MAALVGCVHNYIDVHLVWRETTMNNNIRAIYFPNTQQKFGASTEVPLQTGNGIPHIFSGASDLPQNTLSVATFVFRPLSRSAI